MNIKKCTNCGKETEHHAKGLCFNCYRNFVWKRKKFICKRCKREMPLHAKGLCVGCYHFVFQLDKIKIQNYKKYPNISPELYSKITQKCLLCDFNKIVDLHHLDENKQNNSEANLIGLCPNHHKMFHDFRFKQEINQKLIEKGINLPEDPKLNFSL